MHRTLRGLWIAVTLALLASAFDRGHASAQESIILATTTSTQDSGLLDMLVPRFEKERGIAVKVIAVGTGAALRMASTGDADVVFVHAPDAEKKYVEGRRPDRGSTGHAQRLRHRGPARRPGWSR